MELEHQALRELPVLAKYKCYRSFLADYFAYKKSLRSSFSYRQFATMVGLKSPNYLQLVIQGKRNLSETTGARLAQAIGLKKDEIGYFEALVKFDNAINEAERVKAIRNIHSKLKKLTTHIVNADADFILKHWHLLPVRELVELNDFEASGEYISEKLGNILSKEQAQAALQDLIRTGYITFDGQRYALSEPVLDTGIDIFNHTRMQTYHSELLAVWSKNMDKLGYQGQELGVLNIPIPSSKIPELQAKIRQFQDEIIGWSQEFTEKTDLVQLGTYLMHLTDKDSR